MRINSEENVDVRFFGAHDRAWIPLKDVFLYSEDPPIQVKNKKKGNLEGCIHEVDLYINNIKEKFGKFVHAPFKTNLDPRKEQDQILMLYPDVSKTQCGKFKHLLHLKTFLQKFREIQLFSIVW